MLGTANVSGSALADKIDLFGWSGSTGTAIWGISTSTTNSYYTGTFVDWGKNTIGTAAPNTYRTLTNDEWAYLLNTRTNANEKKGVARIQLSETDYANGLILLPDSWNCPTDVTFKSGFASTNSDQAYADYQTFTLTQWQQLESAGAVFLPAAGSRYKSGMNYVQYDGYYWSASAYSSSRAYYLCFYSNGAYANYGSSLVYGQAVRLVQDVRYTITVTAKNGTVTGAGTYDYGTEVELKATPNEGYAFSQWSDGTTANPYSFVVTKDITIEAKFVPTTPTDLDTAEGTAGITPRKIFRNGQIYILRNDNTYTLTGVRVE